jgi:hypothetical protein
MRPVRGWDELDAFTGWRRVVKRMGKAGVRAAIKRRCRRRERREGNYQAGLNSCDIGDPLRECCAGEVRDRPRITRNFDTPEAREFWRRVEESAREVRSWPAWRRSLSRIAITPNEPHESGARCATE